MNRDRIATRINRIAILGVILALAGGCSDAASPVSYSGTYILTTVDGQPIPFRLPGTAFGGRTGYVTGGSIELSAMTYRYSIRHRWLEPNGTLWLDSDNVEEGFYRIENNRYYFEYQTGVRNGLYLSFPAASNTEIAHTADGHTYRFVRQ